MFDEKFIFKKLGDLEVGKEYQHKISNRFAALENISDNENINIPWENIKGDIKKLAKDSLVLCERKEHKP